MTVFARCLVGLIVIPIVLILVLSLVNLIISTLFFVAYATVQTSCVWIPYGFLIVFLVITFLVDTDETTNR